MLPHDGVIQSSLLSLNHIANGSHRISERLLSSRTPIVEVSRYTHMTCHTLPLCKLCKIIGISVASLVWLEFKCFDASRTECLLAACSLLSVSPRWPSSSASSQSQRQRSASVPLASRPRSKTSTSRYFDLLASALL